LKNILELRQTLESYGKKRTAEVDSLVKNYSEMTETERSFITGLLMQYRPKNVLELGVSSGSGSIVILNGIKDIEGTTLHSVDLLERWYLDQNKSSGWLVETLVPELTYLWNLHLGLDAVEVMDTIVNTNGKVDFVVLDTAHIHPVETLNFLCVLPYLKNGAVVVLHDISLHITNAGYSSNSYACRLLFDSVTANKLTPKEKYTSFPNIGAFQVSEDTKKYIYGMFSSLMLPWSVLHARPWQSLVPTGLLSHYAECFEKFYGESYKEMFLDSVKAQNDLFKNVPFLSFVKMLLKHFVYGIIQTTKNKIIFPKT